MRATPQICIDILKRDEACVLRVYDDARPQHLLQPGEKPLGKLTSGYGHTGFIYAGDVISQAKAVYDLACDLKEAAAKLAAAIGSDIVALLTENQYAALLLFVFNTGTGHKDKPEWNIWKVLKKQQFDQVPQELARFVNGVVDGKMVKISGLVKRRGDEIELWSKDEPGSVDVVLPSSVTRVIETPPTSADPVPVSKSKTVMTSFVGMSATLPVAVKQVSEIFSNVADKSQLISNTITVLAIVAAIAVVATVVFALLHKLNDRN